jgi:hypothetical protein
MADFTQFTRFKWLELSDRFHDHLDRTFAALPSAAWDRRTGYLGWRARDVLAHMTSAMPINFREMLDRALSGHPEPPAEFNTFTRNARAVAAHRGRSISDLVKEFHAESASILATYRGLSDADWLRPAWFFVGPVNVRALFLVQFADNVFHERDLLKAAGQWEGIDPLHSPPLVDWFVREYRPAGFRPERAADIEAVVVYRLAGVGGGEWTLRVANCACAVGQGAAVPADVTVEADVEDLVAAALARAAPVVGHVARALDWVRGPSRAEDVVAAVTGATSVAVAMSRGRIRIHGDRALARRVNGAFWHFWQRTDQTAANLARGA